MYHRFSVDEPIEPDREIRLTGDEFHHAVVRRVRPGETVEIFGPEARACLAVVIEVLDDELVLHTTGEAPLRESFLDLTLGMALIKPDRFELVLQKGTELGVSRFVPVLSDRTEVRIERIEKRTDRWNRIIEEAVKQCGRSRLPALSAPMAFEEMLGNPPCFILDANAESTGFGPQASAATLLIGPEGGFTPNELRQAAEYGCVGIRIGPRRLRAETAALAAVTLIQSEWGDLGS